MIDELETTERYDGRGDLPEVDRLFYGNGDRFFQGQRITAEDLPLSVSETATKQDIDVALSPIWMKTKIWSPEVIQNHQQFISVFLEADFHTLPNGSTPLPPKHPENQVYLTLVSINENGTVWYVGQDHRKEASYWVEFYSEPTSLDLTGQEFAEGFADTR